jgi:transcription elongation factor Elf1
MSLFIDQNFVSQVSPRLEKFKRKNQKTYNFRCPLCGDSAKSKIKCRGYFYVKNDSISFYCHNCLRSFPLGTFLKEFAFDLYEQYIFERYKESGGHHHKVIKDDYSEFDFKYVSNPSIFDPYFSISKLSDDHFAKQYIIKRKIPKKFWKDLYFVPDFKELVDKLEPENQYGLKSGDQRIVIPFRDKEKRIIAIQGRSFENRGLRYITIKLCKDSPKIFGLDRVCPKNRVYVVEGCIDSFFLTNSIAAAGSNLNSDILSLFDDMVFIYDSEPRNKTIVHAMKTVADSCKKLCVWPDDMPGKDINDFILSGMSSKEIKAIIDNNTYDGLSARIAINRWKRC